MAITLHEEIVAILKETGEKLRTKDIADKVNQRKNYLKKDGSEVTPFQIHGRTKNYPDLFFREGNYVGLIEWQKENADKITAKKSVTLDVEISEILNINGEELTTKVIADTINTREIYKNPDGSKVTPGQIFTTVKSFSKIFDVNGDVVRLAKWDDEGDDVSELRDHTELLKQELSDFNSKIETNKININLKSVSVANFKAYANLQELKLKPITLLFGPNSSGKSSLIHSILYLNNAFTTKILDTHFMTISGDSVDLGGFKQLLNKRDPNQRLKFAIEIDSNETKLKSEFPFINKIKVLLEISQPQKEKKEKKIIRVENEIDYFDEVSTGEFIPVGNPFVEKYEIQLNDEPLLSMSANANLMGPMFAIFRIDYLNKKTPFLKELISALLLTHSTKTNIDDDDWLVIDECMDKLVVDLYASPNNFIPKGIKLAKREQNQIESSQVIQPISKSSLAVDFFNALNLFLPFRLNDLFEEIYDNVERQFSTMVYLGPVRSYPPRHLPFSSNNDPNWKAGGGEAWEKLRDIRITRDKVNGWLSGDKNKKMNSKYRLEVRKYADTNGNDFISQLHEAAKELDFDLSKLSTWYSEEEVVEKISKKINEPDAVEGINDLVLFDVDKKIVVSHRDVGFGISQVIPVLVNLYGNKNKIIMIEQPEIHLHPALQAELGDVVIESALGENKNVLILENHSEHMMLRILRRIRESSEGELPPGIPSIKPEDVNVIYVNMTPKGAELVSIPITEDGDFAIKWPQGFFTERAEELF